MKITTPFKIISLQFLEFDSIVLYLKTSFWRNNRLFCGDEEDTCPMLVNASFQSISLWGNIIIVRAHQGSGTNLDAATIYRWAKVVPLAFSHRATPLSGRHSISRIF